MQPSQLPNGKKKLKISFYKKLCRKKWFRILRPFLIIILIILLIYVLTVLGVFKIKKVEINNDLQYVQDVTQVTNQYLNQGYFSLDLEQLEEEIKNSNKYVKDVSAEKIFPNKIYLKIEEYAPMSYLEYKDTCYILSQEGFILEESTEYEECVLRDGILLETEENIFAEDELIYGTEILAVVKVLEEFGWEVTIISLSENILEINDGERTVTARVDEEYETQLSKLYLVLEKVNIEQLKYRSLDLRFDRPVMELL